MYREHLVFFKYAINVKDLLFPKEHNIIRCMTTNETTQKTGSKVEAKLDEPLGVKFW